MPTHTALKMFHEAVKTSVAFLFRSQNKGCTTFRVDNVFFFSVASIISSGWSWFYGQINFVFIQKIIEMLWACRYVLNCTTVGIKGNEQAEKITKIIILVWEFEVKNNKIKQYHQCVDCKVAHTALRLNI